MNAPSVSEQEADERLARNGKDIDALIAKADHRLAAGERRAAAAFYGAALAASRQGQTGERAGLARAAAQAATLQAGMLPHIVHHLEGAGHPRADWHPRFAKALAVLSGQAARDPVDVRYPQMPTAYFHPDLPETPFHDASALEWARAIEDDWQTVRHEGETLLTGGEALTPYVRKVRHRPQGDVHGMLENSDWTTFELTAKGTPDPERVALCPQTFDLVTTHAPLCDIEGRAPSIMFSLLRSGKHIPPHHGMINARLICHLPLIVPGDGVLRVGDERRKWEEGKLLVFDDSVEHEARNHAASDRLVLIFDIWHPALEPAEKAQITALFQAVDAY